MKTTATVRVWKGIHEAYKELAEDCSALLSDIISFVLLYAALEDWLITFILQAEYELNFEAARKYAGKLKEKLTELIEVLEAVESGKEKT